MRQRSPALLLSGILIFLFLSGCASVPAALPTVTPGAGPVPAEESTVTIVSPTEPVPTSPEPTPEPQSPPAVVLPSTCPAGIFPTIGSPGQANGISALRPTYRFPFGEYGTITLSIPVAMDVYSAASRADKNAYLDRSTAESAWVPCYYRSFITDSHQEVFYNNLLGGFRQIRADSNLDEERYLELIVAFVQSIPYSTEQGAPKFPVETFVDYSGDCDDKALLLAALLSREGYNASLLYFGREKHMGVGIADPENPFRSSGYAYTEATVPSTIGNVPERIQGGRQLSSDPLVILIGEGSRTYGSGAKVKEIRAAYNQSRERIFSRLPSLDNDYELLDTLIARGEIFPYYESFHGQDAEYSLFCDDVLTYSYISSHPNDPSGTVQWLRSR